MNKYTDDDLSYLWELNVTKISLINVVKESLVEVKASVDQAIKCLESLERTIQAETVTKIRCEGVDSNTPNP
tara:strand:+ start:481 stop:696 length:216 start_codon:yes stop_codon:yes gene_type:complete